MKDLKIKSFDELKHGQKIKVNGDPSSSYNGHIAEFEAMSTLFNEDVAIVNFIDPKPRNYLGEIVEGDMIYLHEIELT